MLLDKYLILFFVTLLPFLEARASVPLAFIYKLPLLPSFFVVLLANILVIFIAYFVIDWFFDFLLNFNFFKYFVEKIRKKAKKYEKLELIAISFFVAVPLPGSGAYSGVLLAEFLGIPRREAILYISFGVFILVSLLFVGFYLFSGFIPLCSYV